MNGFSVEESNLISIFAGESRPEVIKDISRALKYLEDNVLAVRESAWTVKGDVG